ncbi:MAG: carbohydrate ABC transporter permease [Microthrixaceae bacterium]
MATDKPITNPEFPGTDSAETASANAGTPTVESAQGKAVVASDLRPPKKSARHYLGLTGSYLLLTSLSVVILFPIYMLILRAVSSPLAYISAGQPLHPVDIQWDVFKVAFVDANLGRAMGLSFVVTMIIVTAQLVTATLAAYAFAFLEFPFKNVFFGLIVGTLLLPIEVTLIANVETIRRIGMLNSVQGLTLPFLATAVGIFLIRQGFLGIPSEIRDASNLDGYGHFRFMFKVALPMSKPIVGSFIVISFLGAWNQYVWPRFATDRQKWQTVQVALKTIGSENPERLNLSFAAAIVAALPLLVLLIFFQRQIVRGLTAGAVKG